MSEYTREEFELDRAGQTGEDLREKFKSSTPTPDASDRIKRVREWLPKQDWYPFKECRNKDDWMAGAFADFAALETAALTQQVEELKRENERLWEQVHKTDGMANEINHDTQCPYVRHREDEHFNCVLAPGHKGAHQDVFGSTEGPWGLDEWTETETT